MTTDSRTQVLVPAPALHDIVRACFEGLNLRSQDAAAVADALIYANLRGIDSHGFDRVPVYMRRVKAGLAGGTERMAVVARRDALCRIDAGQALGPAVGVRAVDLAIECALERGIGMVAVGASTHCGAAGFYAMRAAARGLVGIVATNAAKRMAPYGSREAFLGANALAIAVPMGDREEFVLDMSSTVMAQGRIRRALASGTAIEEGAALDPSGDPTTDPAKALAGTMLPSGGPKGSGLAFAITLLVGLLAGADFDDEVASLYADFSRPQNLGQLFLVIDPAGVTTPDAATRLTDLADRFGGLPPRPGFDRVRYAGQQSADCARERERSGIPIEIGEVESVVQACLDCELQELAHTVGALLDAPADGHS